MQSTVSVTVSFEQSEKPLKDWPVANFQRVFVNFDRAWQEFGHSVQLDHSLITHSPGHRRRQRSGVTKNFPISIKWFLNSFLSHYSKRINEILPWSSPQKLPATIFPWLLRQIQEFFRSPFPHFPLSGIHSPISFSNL